MRSVFADTGYWIALLNPDDDLHPRARQVSDTVSSNLIVTSEMILVELLNAFSSKGCFYRQKAVSLTNYILNSFSISVVSHTNTLFREALNCIVSVLIRHGVTQTVLPLLSCRSEES